MKIMKTKLVIEVIAENYLEQQAILGRFPEAVWISPPGIENNRTLFYLPETKYQQILDFIEEYNRVQESENG